MPLADFDSAAKMRDVISSIVRGVLTDLKPSPVYGTVASLDRTNRTALVAFPGGGGVNVPMRTIQPYAAGAVVRVAGESGDRYVDDVVAGTNLAWLEASWLSMKPSGVANEGGLVELVGATSQSGFTVQAYNGLLQFKKLASPATVVATISTTGDLTLIGGATVTGTVLAAKVQAGAGTNANPAEPFHVFGTNAGYSFSSRTGTSRWILYAPDATWGALFNSADRLKISAAEGRVMMGFNGHGMSASLPDTTLAIGGNRNTGGGASASFGKAQVVILNSDTNGVGAIAFWCNAHGTAPQILHPGASGETIFFVNSANSAHIPIVASAFTVVSSERIKDDIEPLLAADVGRAAETSFTEVVSAIPTRRWVRGNESRAKVVDHETGERRNHVCGVDCEAAEGEKCSIGMNDAQPGIGLVAEEVAAVLPEAVVYGEDRLPLGLDLSKLVGALWAAVTELSEKVSRLEATQAPDNI